MVSDTSTHIHNQVTFSEYFSLTNMTICSDLDLEEINSRVKAICEKAPSLEVEAPHILVDVSAKERERRLKVIKKSFSSLRLLSRRA